MKRYLPVFCFLFLFIVRPVAANYQTARADFTYQYSQYRGAHDRYQVAKSSYLTYRTLTAQTEAIASLRLVVQARDQVIFSYYDLLQEKLNATPGVSVNYQTTFSDVKANEKTWLAAHQKTIDAAASLEDLNNVSREFEDRYPEFDTETKQAFGTVLLAKEATLRVGTDALIDSLNTNLVRLRQDGASTTFADRGLISIKDKLGLYDQKMTAARVVFFSKNTRDPISVFVGQQRLSEANQYLREALTQFREIIKSITG
ncbi:hypothetical protein HY440_03260 [Candidatus Microgenomates bacterium]|nr:hypothetical protein [Candidatus Microgenomates bacterium]